MSTMHVDIERWREAQEWELSVWKNHEQKKGLRRFFWMLKRPLLQLIGSKRLEGDDDNHWWAAHFNNYSFLPKHIDSYIELGCGPYTNTRLIVQNRTFGKIICSDPLIKSYLAFKWTWLAKAYRSSSIIIDDHPIETCPFAASSFDVVVMINVLDHVMDADLCLKTAIHLVKPGGFFILGQDLCNEEDIRRQPYNLGHPIRLKREDLEPYLVGLSPIIRKDLDRSEGRSETHYSTLIFAGRKPG